MNLKVWVQRKEGWREGGRKAAFPDVEEDLTAWIEGLRAKNFRVTRKSIKMKAKELAQERGKSVF